MLDKVLVIDLEATCWENEPPKGQKSEIIEIGVALVDVKTRRIDRSEGILIKPEYSTVSDFCTKLTTITQDMLDRDGITLAEAREKLINEYQSPERTWVSWGRYDHTQIMNDCREKRVPYFMGKNHINLKNLFALKQRLRREVGVKKAMEILGLDFEGTHHRGVDDARNIARILSYILG